jgi:hypothetical protein
MNNRHDIVILEVYPVFSFQDHMELAICLPSKLMKNYRVPQKNNIISHQKCM